jgi:hypothetical protein
VVAAIDWDNNQQESARRLAAIQPHAHGVVRLPHRTAIERALTDGVPASALIAALLQLEAVYGLRLPQDLDRADEATVRNVAMRQLKDSNGLHAEFVAALPAGSLPPLATRLLGVMLELAEGRRSGTVDL